MAAVLWNKDPGRRNYYSKDGRWRIYHHGRDWRVQDQKGEYPESGAFPTVAYRDTLADAKQAVEDIVSRGQGESPYKPFVDREDLPGEPKLQVVRRGKKHRW